jgi:hypothetical protein
VADVIYAALDLDAVCQKVGIGVAQCGVAVDLEGDVHEPELAALRSDGVGGHGETARPSALGWSARRTGS